MKKRRWLLPALLMTILVPVVSALIFSTRGLYAQRDAMVKMAQRYSQGLARSITREESGSPTETPLQRHRRMGLFLKMLTVGPPVPGWIAVVGPGGIKLQGSPGSRIVPEIAEKVNLALATGQMQTLTVQIDRHPPSAAAVCPYADGLRAIVVVISHYLVPGQMMRLTMFQPVAGIIASALALIGIFLLWRWCVLPLRSLASLVESLHWGRDVLKAPSPGPLPELREMRRALSELSRRAVDREELKRNYVGDIVRTQEEERSRLAREIHDSPLQTVSSLIQRVQLALRGLSKEQIDRERVSSHLSAAQEAAMNAVKYKLGNLVAIVDNNGLEADGSIDEITSIGDIGNKYRVFGWNVVDIDGNDIYQIVNTFNNLPDAASTIPTCIVAHTIKGKGVSFMENQVKWHAGKISDDQLEMCIIDLKEAYEQRWKK